MNALELLKSLSFNLTSVAHCRLGREWNYQNILSSFTRLYLITDGEGWIQAGEKLLQLKKGYMYLVPGFVQSTYKCPDFLEQYYATFTVSLPGNMSVYQLFRFKNEVRATDFHYDLFKKLCVLNQGMGLPTGDPRIYQKQIRLGVESTVSQSAQSVLQSAGILNLLYAEFVEAPKMKLQSEVHNRIVQSIEYIHNHLSDPLSVAQLARQSSLSADHYTRLFKQLTSQTPLDYINQQRIEKAIHLLGTTTELIGDIADRCGFTSSTYFGKVFKRLVGQSPGAYRKNRLFANAEER